MAKTFTPTARKREVIEFDIPRDGESEMYHFDPPKIAGAMMPVLDPNAVRSASDGEDDDEEGGGARVSMTQATWAWLRKGLPTEEYDRLMDRLQEDDDDLDVPDVAQVVRWMMSQVTGRPTGSRRG